MESERHAFMRKFLELCVATGVGMQAFDGPLVALANGDHWIQDLRVDVNNRTCTGYWDGERHEVWL